jgi:3-phenylpropionate/trans-cinnamate dioxygenase ferredoxin reductase subunit
MSLPTTNGSGSVEFLIIGDGPTALSAAQAFREHDGKGRVVVISPDPDTPYERPPLSKGFLRGELEESELPYVQPTELDDLEVERVEDRAVALDPRQRTVRTRRGDTYTYVWCLVATGATPIQLPVPGGDDARLLYLRTLADSRRLREEAIGSATKTAIVVGSGFIGCEAAASLARLGLTVTMVTNEPAPQQKRLGPEAAAKIAGWLTEDGVTVRLNAEVASFSADDEGPITVELGDGSSVGADLVLVAAGVRPFGELAQDAGIPSQADRILVDASMRSSVPGVLAAGDAAMAYNAAAGRPLAVEHWGEALTMGGIAGATAAGDAAEWKNAPGFWSDIGDRTLKYAAWGDGYEDARMVEHGDGAFTVWYTDKTGAAVGVLTHDRDDDYEAGTSLVEQGSPAPEFA